MKRSTRQAVTRGKKGGDDDLGSYDLRENGSTKDEESNPASTDDNEDEEQDIDDNVGSVVVRRRGRSRRGDEGKDMKENAPTRRVSSRSTKFTNSLKEPRSDSALELFASSRSERIVARSSRNADRNVASDEDEDDGSPESPIQIRRTSSRSTKFTNSMKEPPSESVRDLFREGQSQRIAQRSRGRDESDKLDDSSDSDESEAPMRRRQPPKPPSHRRRVRSSPRGRKTGMADDSDDYDSDETDEESEEEEEVDKIQRIIASRSERRSKWREICNGMNTSEITDGSRWFQEANAEADEKDDTEERFLVKWSGMSYLHASWETQDDLVEQTEGAKVYFSNFFRKSVNGLLFTQEERCDGDYFDPSFIQIERILKISYDGKMPRTAEEEDKFSSSDFGIVLDRKDSKFEDGVGRIFTIKWANTPYADATEEFERDLILMDVEYKDKLKKFLQRSKKPSKKQAGKANDKEWRRAFKVFREGNGDESAHEQGVQGYQQMLRDHVFPNGGKLRDYQAEGIAWMVSNKVNERSSILADEMGLGKTLQTAAYIDLLISKYRFGPALVVVPLSTISHWQREFSSWTNLNAVVYHGSAKDRETMRELEFAYESDRPRNGVGANQLYLKKCLSKGASQWMVQVVITTPEILVAEDWRELTAVKWDVLVVDEAHRLKNHNSKLAVNLRTDAFSFEHKILLTGTPIQNDVKEFWTLMNFIDPVEYGDMDAFLQEYGDMKSKETIDDLHEKIRPYILRRLKEDVEKSVPPKEETLIEVELTLLQKQYYRALYEKNVGFLHKNKKALDGPSLNNLAMQLRKCCNHLFLLNGVEDEVRKDKMHDGSFSEAQFLVDGSGKFVLLDKLLPRLKENGHRVLIFSQFKIMLDILEDYLPLRNMSFERIDGSITGRKRQQAIDRFQLSEGKDPPFVMLLSTRAGGVGINLTAADTVIIFDSDWNPQNDLQAQARCHRIGQTKDVKVYRLLTRKSYEMQMFHMSSLKMGLDQAVLKGFESGASGEGAMSKEEVERLLRHGAYDIFNEEKAGAAESESNAFIQQDIDEILKGRTQTLVHHNTGTNSGAAGGTFSKASFKAPKTPGGSSNQATDDVDIDDPDFWSKMVGEAPVEEMTDLGTRKRNQTNYSEKVWEDRLEAAMGESPSRVARGGADSSDYSSEDDDDESVSDGDAPTRERAHWGGSKTNQWKREQAESVLRLLETYGYANLPWGEFIKKLPRWKRITENEVKRMCWSLMLLALYESAKDDAALIKKRAERAAEKKREQEGSEAQADLQPEESLRASSFRKLWNSNSSWLDLVLKDAVAFARGNKPRAQGALDHSKHENKISTLFYNALWPSLKSRGWKEQAASHGKHLFFGEYRFTSPREALNEVSKIHPELTNMVIPILEKIEASHQRDLAEAEEDRSQHLGLTAANVDADTMLKFLQKYAPLQLLVDRNSHSLKKISLSRKTLLPCACMHAATVIVRRAAETSSDGDLNKRLMQLILIDPKSALPHPLWTQTHDAVLIQAIAKHGWIDRQKSCRAISDDADIRWGPPFDSLERESGQAGETSGGKPGIDENELEKVRNTASRASNFLNIHHEMLEALKGCNRHLIVESYCLVTDDGGDEESDVTKWNVDDKVLLRSLSNAGSEGGTLNEEPLDLPSRKELAKRAKTIVMKSIASLDERVSLRQSSASVSSTKPPDDHGFAVIDQGDRCCVLLAEMVRGLLKASPSKMSNQLRLLCSIAHEEALALKRMFESTAAASNDGGNNSSKASEMQRLADQVLLAKKCLASTTTPAKNVLRVMLGLEPIAPRSPSEGLFPSKETLEQIRAAQKERPKKETVRRDEGAAGERSIVRAMKKAKEANKGMPAKFSRADDSDSGLQLTMVETLILFSFCSEGIPPENSCKHESRQAVSRKFGLSWEDIGKVLEMAAKDNYQVASDKLKKSRSALKKFESAEDDSLAKQLALKKFEIAQIDESMRENAARQATDYAAEPEKLAKKSIMLMEKVRRYAGQFAGVPKNAHKLENGLGFRVPTWLGKELAKWAQQFDVADTSGKTLAYTTKELLEQNPSYENTTVAAVLDKKSCRHITCQVALLTRLRSILLKYGEEQSKQRILQAAKSSARLEDVWDKRPSWWLDSTDELPGGHNVLLLGRLSEHGFLNVLADSSGFGPAGGELGEESMKDLGLTKSIIQLRANQLVRELHALEESEETMRLLKERRNRVVANREGDKPLAECQSSKSSSRGSIQTGLHAFFTSTKSGPKKGSVVVLSSNGYSTGTSNSLPKGKRKGLDADEGDSPSEKKTRKIPCKSDIARLGKRKDPIDMTRSPSSSPEKKLRSLLDVEVEVVSVKPPPLKG